MHSTIAILSAAALFGSTMAANTIYVNNNCSFPIAFSTAGGNIPASTSTLQPGDSFNTPLEGSGLSLQARQVENGPDNELDVSVSDGTIYYALGGNQGYTAFQDNGLSIIPSDSTCPSIVCAPEDTNCPIAETFACATSTNTDLTFTVCTA